MDRPVNKTETRRARAAAGPQRPHAPVSRNFDRWLHAEIGRYTSGISPGGVAEAWFDWASHLALAPARASELAMAAGLNALHLAERSGKTLAGDAPEALQAPEARRFADEAWEVWPFSVYRDAFLMQQAWWRLATRDIPGATEKHLKLTGFLGHQALEALSPGNWLWTNPQVLERTAGDGGANLVRGAQYLVEDALREITGQPDPQLENFRVGEKLAVTPGQVVYRNELIELIQYAPTTDKVRPEPILIVPAWIMKYYILDLSPHNSLIRYMVGEGFTVFVISWRNPTSEHRDMMLDDYRRLGPLAALDAVGTILGPRPVHAVGYCLGGTLLTLTAAAMARDHDERIASLTLLAAQTDFSEPGELGLFIDESQVAFLEDMMWQGGTLDAEQMVGAFLLIRVHDLFWGKMTREYLMGERTQMIDLMAWNADATRMPYAMHSEYLRQLYLGNALAEGRFVVDGAPVAIPDIRTDMFVVGTERDHIAPWRSVYKIHLLADTEITFCLTSSGHNAGIVSEPGHKGRHRRVRTSPSEALYVGPTRWLEETPALDGSWWTDWVEWLSARSGEPVPPPPMGRPDRGLPPLAAAPGRYVLER